MKMTKDTSDLLVAAIGGGGLVSLVTLINNIGGTSVQNRVENLKSEIQALERHSGHLERELTVAQATIANKIDPLYDAMDRIDRGRFSGQDAENFKEVLQLLQRYRKTSEKLTDCKAAGRYFSSKNKEWSKDATQSFIKARPKQIPFLEKRRFNKEVSILLNWISSSLLQGGPKDVSIYEKFDRKVANSSEPYVFVLEHIKRNRDWPTLTNSQANYVERMLDVAIERAREHF